MTDLQTSPALTTAQLAAAKAWATRRARALSGEPAPVKLPAIVHPDGMTAGQKAAATRRARAAAAAVSPIVTTSPTPAAIADQPRRAIVNVSTDASFARAPVVISAEYVAATEFQMIEIGLDNSKVGSGQRRFVVLGKSSHFVKLFYVPTLETLEVAADYFARNHVPALRVKRPLLIDIVKRNVALADKSNDAAGAVIMNDGGADAVTVMRLLGAI